MPSAGTKGYPGQMKSLLILAAAVLMPGLAVAQNTPHPPHINQEWNADHFRFEYDDGTCHLDYEYNFKDGRMHLDKHGDCANVSIPRF